MEGAVVGAPDDGLRRVGHHLRASQMVDVDRVEHVVAHHADQGARHRSDLQGISKSIRMFSERPFAFNGAIFL